MKVAVVHTGARDSYQVAEAFYERGELSKLFTSAYIDPRRIRLLSILGVDKGRRRTSRIPQELVSSCYYVDLLKHCGRFLGLEKLSSQYSERVFGHRAIQRMRDVDSVVCYNYMAQHVLPHVKSRKVLFQCHPNPVALTMFEMSDDQFRVSGFAVEREFSWGAEYRSALEKEWQYADRIIAPSSFVKKSLEIAGASSSNIVVVPYGCPMPIRNIPRKPPSGRLSLLFVGQFVWRKGVDQLGEFAQKFRDRGDLTIITRGLIDRDLLAKIKMHSNVRILIDVSDRQLQENYQISDALIFPSRYEGYGLVINEALSHGLPIISSRNTALYDILQTHSVGSLMADISSEAMLASISAIFDEGKYSDFSEQALDYARRNPWTIFRSQIRNVVENDANSV